jgi:hypothetical protein
VDKVDGVATAHNTVQSSTVISTHYDDGDGEGLEQTEDDELRRPQTPSSILFFVLDKDHLCPSGISSNIFFPRVWSLMHSLIY